MLGQWCDVDKDKFCQERGGCDNCGVNLFSCGLSGNRSVFNRTSKLSINTQITKCRKRNELSIELTYVGRG